MQTNLPMCFIHRWITNHTINHSSFSWNNISLNQSRVHLYEIVFRAITSNRSIKKIIPWVWQYMCWLNLDQNNQRSLNLTSDYKNIFSINSFVMRSNFFIQTQSSTSSYKLHNSISSICNFKTRIPFINSLKMKI